MRDSGDGGDAVFLGEGQCFPVIQPAGGGNGLRQGEASDMGLGGVAVGNILDKQVEGIFVAKDELVFAALHSDTAGGGQMEGFVIQLCPDAQNLQHAPVNEPQTAVSHGTHVQQQIGPVPAAVRQIPDYIAHGHVAEVQGCIAPMVVQHLAHLAGDVPGRILQVDGLGLAPLKGDAVQFHVAQSTPGFHTGIVDDDGFRLIAPDGSVQGIFFPVRITGLAPGAVEPQSADGAVVGAQQLDTFPQVAKICREICFKGFLVPVKQRMVEEGLDACFPTGIHEFPDQIPAAAVDRIEIGKTAGVVQGIYPCIR